MEGYFVIAAQAEAAAGGQVKQLELGSWADMGALSVNSSLLGSKAAFASKRLVIKTSWLLVKT